jgi:hypothetical protein
MAPKKRAETGKNWQKRAKAGKFSFALFYILLRV